MLAIFLYGFISKYKIGIHAKEIRNKYCVIRPIIVFQSNELSQKISKPIEWYGNWKQIKNTRTVSIKSEWMIEQSLLSPWMGKILTTIVV